MDSQEVAPGMQETNEEWILTAKFDWMELQDKGQWVESEDVHMNSDLQENRDKSSPATPVTQQNNNEVLAVVGKEIGGIVTEGGQATAKAETIRVESKPQTRG